jgi:hypothetical protein
MQKTCRNFPEDFPNVLCVSHPFLEMVQALIEAVITIAKEVYRRRFGK